LSKQVHALPSDGNVTFIDIMCECVCCMMLRWPGSVHWGSV